MHTELSVPSLTSLTYLGVIGSFVVSHMRVVDHVLGTLRDVEQCLLDKELREDCVVSLNNVDDHGRTMGEDRLQG